MIGERIENYTLDASTGWSLGGYTNYISFDTYNADLGGNGVYMRYTSSISRTISTVGYDDISIVIGMLILFNCYNFMIDLTQILFQIFKDII